MRKEVILVQRNIEEQKKSKDTKKSKKVIRVKVSKCRCFTCDVN